MTESKASRIKRVRNEILVTLNRTFPASLQSKSIMNCLIAVFPDMEWGYLIKDIEYLLKKGYIERLIDDGEKGREEMTSYKNRWWRLTAEGKEIADDVIDDEALEF